MSSPNQGKAIHETIQLLIENLIRTEDTTGEYLLRLADGRTIDTKSWQGWDWTQGIGLYGLYQYYTLAGSPEILSIITDWFSHQLENRGGTSKNINTMAAFLTLAYLYEETADERFRPWLEAWADRAMFELPRTRFGGMQHVTYDLENPGELWDDTLMMTVMPLAKIGKVLGRNEFVEEAKKQFLVHIQYLFDSWTGLWFHGWKFEGDVEMCGMLGHNFARARWARGNAWATIAIPEILELLDLPPGDAFRVYLISVLEAQCTALKRLQCNNGLWRTLLDVPESEGSYPESSATAGIAYGVWEAVRLRYLDQSYRDVGIRAVKAITGRINQGGELLGTSFGTPVGSDLQHYKDIPRTSMPYGQAMAIMALGEYLRTFL